MLNPSPGGDAQSDELKKLTVKELLGRMKVAGVKLTRDERDTKASLVHAILFKAPEHEILFLCELSRQKESSTEDLLGQDSRKRKRPAETKTSRRTAPRTEPPPIDEPALEHLIDRFLSLPSQDELHGCYRDFYQATSNNAVAFGTCAVCARERSVHGDGLQSITIEDIPNPTRLSPSTGLQHRAHNIVHGMLLDEAGITQEDESTSVSVCQQCMTALKDSRTSKPPKFSLANNLWIGRIPLQLRALTFPEQLLISLLYPRVFVFKLSAKRAYGQRDETRQRAMRGNVSTYDQDIDGIASMTQGHLMPRPPTILASIMSVTFIGNGPLPKEWLHSTFRVRRRAVLDALLWLKEHNPKYYGDIEISDARIGQLPEDDIPDEILANVHQSTDVGILDEEHSGYVPRDDVEEPNIGDEEQSDQRGGQSQGHTDRSRDSSKGPDVIPLQVSGLVDTDLSNITASELMSYGLANLWEEGLEGGYAVRHGQGPVSDFGRPRKGETRPYDPHRDNFFAKAFPFLFPYGYGGIEADRPVPVSFTEHVRWAILYHDRRFRRHETFPFVAFGIEQRRQVLNSARIQMRRKTFAADARLLSTITKEKLEKAIKEEESKQPISDPAVRLLRQHIHATGGRVMGSDQSRYQLRSQIWSTTILKGPPYLWITINPCDLHDPIAQIFAGEKIDLDAFLATLGPDKARRAENIASDPYAAAKFFHFMVGVILETLFKVKVTAGSRVSSEKGIFGHVSAYFGTVESQGRGTLHLHMLIWLEGCPTSDEMHELLQTEEFRQRVKDYINANMRAYLPGLDSQESVKAIQNEVEIAYSRPPNPDAPDYKQELKAFELRVARAKQVHTCEVRRCLLPDGRGGLRCKRRAPFDVALESFIDEAGQWGPKRLYEFMNNWNPSITVCIRCNNDCKLLPNGRDTKNVTFYVTGYSAKKQGDYHNMSALVAKGHAFHVERNEHIDNVLDDQRKLLIRVLQRINREQELAAVMVISYLMGWGDTFKSHHYTAIFWSSFVGTLLRIFPGLKLGLSTHDDNAHRPNQTADQHGESTTEEEPEIEDQLQSRADHDARDAEEGNDVVTLDSDSSGHVFTRCQVTDYSLRGDELSDYSVMDYFTDTYESDIPARERTANHDDDDIDQQRRPGRGRPRNRRVRYRPQHPKYAKSYRIIRSAGHNTLPNFIGRAFPRNDDPEIRSFYCACMLVLLKPWRDIAKDLKSPAETWEAAFESFVAESSPRITRILSGIQYYHECESAARDQSASNASSAPHAPHSAADEELQLAEDTSPTAAPQSFTEEGLAALQADQVSPREEMHARVAVQHALYAGIFTDDVDQGSWTGKSSDVGVNRAQENHIQDLLRWKQQMDSDIDRQNTRSDIPLPQPPGSSGVNSANRSGRVTQLREQDLDSNEADITGPEVTSFNAGSEAALLPVAPSELKMDQRRAYELVTWHLEQHLSGMPVPPLRLLIHGEGGTGKSKVIQTITEYFATRHVSHKLIKAAYTGVAASLIDGKTTHTIGMISQRGGGLSDESKAKLSQFWEHYEYLILDECSMLSKSFLAKLSRHIGIGKQKPGASNASLSFGGINVILCGDFHQFPPVAVAEREALYWPMNLSLDSLDSQVGRTIYEEFKDVIILKEQMRVTDRTWHRFLQNLRYGRVQQSDLDMLRSLIISNPNCKPTDFTETPWDSASLVTPRHAVRKQWNEAAIRKHCEKTGQRLFICTADDAVKDRSHRPLTLPERYGVAMRAARASKEQGKKKRRLDLPETVELSVGMKVMVTTNVETDLDVTNGARGEIVGVVLHPDEPTFGDEPIIRLQHLPLYVLVKMNRTRARHLDGLAESVIPIEPDGRTFQITIPTLRTKANTRRVRRRQFPMTAAYAFTDYRSQGQTIPYVIVDIASPPSGKLSLFNLYVALSRSSGRETIRLLRDFDDEKFLASHRPELTQEDDRLMKMDEATKEWWSKMRREQTV